MSSASPLLKKDTAAVAYYPPSAGGGSEFSMVNATLGEPLNVIVSGLSTPSVLTNDGFTNFARAICFSTEFLGIHLGAPQTANLGDGHGAKDQILELRQDYGNFLIGTGEETLIGGNHLRLYRQDGPSANSGALFLAVSAEEPVTQQHMIKPNGYNLGRDELVARATKGTPTFGGVKYRVTVQDVSGLLQPGTAGVNHDIAQDGIVKLLTIYATPPTSLLTTLTSPFTALFGLFRQKFSK